MSDTAPAPASSSLSLVDPSSSPRITPAELKKICRSLNLYSTFELNDKLYLHYKGFRKIENLAEFTGLKVLYLEGNRFRYIEGLDHQVELRCLYLQENEIEAIENLDQLTKLDTINLNQNRIEKIENLAPLTQLNTLLLSGNRISSFSDLSGVLECPSISVLDLSKNKLADPKILEILKSMPNLKVLYLKDNPIVKEIQNYRKTLISSIKSLTYLDDRPVFDEERRMVEAWARGGKEAEKAESAQIEKEKREKEEKNFQQFDLLRENAKKEKSKQLGEFIKESKENQLSQEIKTENENNSEKESAEEESESESESDSESSEVDGKVVEDLSLNETTEEFRKEKENRREIAKNIFNSGGGEELKNIQKNQIQEEKINGGEMKSSSLIEIIEQENQGNSSSTIDEID